jgi:hypothetical protein
VPSATQASVPAAQALFFYFKQERCIVKTQTQRAQIPAVWRSIEKDLDSYLDAVVDATMIFSAAVHAYLSAGPDGACWQQARRVTEHMRTLDALQQKVEMGIQCQSAAQGPVSGLMNPLTGVSRLLKDMKRQMTGFAIESGFSGPCRHVPEHLRADLQELTEAVCAAVDALVENCRPSRLLWADQSIAEEKRGVSWYEGEADRLSMQLIRRIFADDSLDIAAKLPLAQLVEEIDRVADYAEAVAKELRASRGSVTVIGASEVYR